jgi:hypothetical protein
MMHRVRDQIRDLSLVNQYHARLSYVGRNEMAVTDQVDQE